MTDRKRTSSGWLGSLEKELQELERTDPKVAKAAANYERVRDEIISKPPLYREFRADGWPLCPQCEEDELWAAYKDGEKPSIANIVGCYACGWLHPKERT